MSAKAILVLCAQAFLVQIVLSQQYTSCAAPYGMAGLSQVSPGLSYDRMTAPELAYNGYAGRVLPCDGYYSPAMEFTITSGGGLPVTSISSICPTGITVKSDNAYEGPVIVTGELPFVSAVAIEGNLPTVGAGGIQYGCGNGVLAMLSEGPATFDPMGPVGYAPGPNMAFDAGSGFGAGSALGLGNGFGLAAGFGPAAGFANANRLGYGGCSSCGCGMLY